MGIHPLDPGSAAGRPDRDVNRGHGTSALGPGDNSDSGSDVVGAPDPSDLVQDAKPDSADIDADRIESVPEDLDADEDLEEG
jgi:hypothetical protein